MCQYRLLAALGCYFLSLPYRMMSGACYPVCPVAEGLAAALEVLDEMETLRAKRYVLVYGAHIGHYICSWWMCVCPMWQPVL